MATLSKKVIIFIIFLSFIFLSLFAAKHGRPFFENFCSHCLTNNHQAVSLTNKTSISKQPPRSYVPLPDKKLVLTFDDGPKPIHTNEILNILKKTQTKAVFFLVGKEAMANKDLVYRIHHEGHEIGNHTFSHRRLDTLSAPEIKQELLKTNQIIENITGHKIKYFRPPGGRFNDLVLQTLAQLPLKLILWQVNANDYIRLSPFFGINGKLDADKIYQRVISQVQNQAIILMHNCSGETTLALPRIITHLKEQGYRFVSLHELLHPTNMNLCFWQNANEHP
jgi:peptidoglycan/xylan/chitin deacetylase (PgdA/CDA1 family)